MSIEPIWYSYKYMQMNMFIVDVDCGNNLRINR